MVQRQQWRFATLRRHMGTTSSFAVLACLSTVRFLSLSAVALYVGNNIYHHVVQDENDATKKE